MRQFRKGICGFNLTLTKEPSLKQAVSNLQRVLNRYVWREIVFCGFGEPLERLDCVLNLSKWIRAHHGNQINIRINTNGHGYLLYEGRNIILELKNAGVDQVCVSLNASNKELYNQVCRPRFEDAFDHVLNFITNAKPHLDVEVSALTIPEVNLHAIKKLAEKMTVPLKIRSFSPFIL